jgi:hypothetical protein
MKDLASEVTEFFGFLMLIGSCKIEISYSMKRCQRLTLWNGKKANKTERIEMRSMDIVAYIANRQVQRIILVVSSANRYHCFVTSEYYGYKCCTERVRVSS